MSVTIKADFSRLDKKLSAGNFKRARQVLANQVGADSNQFVPMGPPNEGALRASQMIAIDGSELSWNRPYGRRMYYGLEGWNWHTPGTGPRWVERAKGQYVDSWLKAYKGGLNL